MKKIIALVVFAAAATVGCKEDGQNAIAPAMISNLKATPSSGAITLKWDNPAEGDHYYYSQIQYTDPVDGSAKKVNVSKFTNTWTLKGLFRKNGDYTFRVYPVSSTHTMGSDYLEVVSRAEAVPSTWTVESKTKITLVADQLSAPPTNEGSLANLLDGNLSTFYHAPWGGGLKVPYPHDFTIKLGKEVEGLTLKLTGRHNNDGGGIGTAQAYGSNDADNVSDADATWTLLADVDEAGDFPSGRGLVYDTPIYSTYVSNGYKFRRFKLHILTPDSEYWMYAELEAFDVKYKEFDPEL